MNAISKLEDACAVLTLVAMTDEIGHDVKEEAARAAMVARHLVEQAIEEISEQPGKSKRHAA